MLVATGRKFVEGPKGVKWDMGIAFLGWVMNSMHWDLDSLAKKPIEYGIKLSKTSLQDPVCSDSQVKSRR